MDENNRSARYDLAIVIPVFNNAHSLPQLFSRLENTLRDLQPSLSIQVVFVNDGSSDASFECVERFRSSIFETYCLSHSKNFGALSAVRSGLRFVTAKRIALMAADLQDPPELLSELVSLTDDGTKLAMCVRRKRGDPFIKKMFANLFYWFVRKFISPNYPKGGFDMCIFSSDILPLINNSSKGQFISFLIHWFGYDYKKIEYDRPERPHGKSSWTFFQSLGASLSVILNFSPNPLRFVGVSGVIIAILSMLYGIFILLSYFWGVKMEKGFPTIIVLISFYFGATIFLLSLIGEYVAKIFNQINGLPDGIVERVIHNEKID